MLAKISQLSSYALQEHFSSILLHFVVIHDFGQLLLLLSLLFQPLEMLNTFLPTRRLKSYLFLIKGEVLGF